MLSVYYQTLGRQFEIRGAPSVLLPPEVRPMSLGDALAVLASSKPRLREALWRTIQNVPAIVPDESKSIQAYPTEIFPYIELEKLKRLIELRRQYRSGANVFAAALIACRDNDFPLFRGLIELLPKSTQTGSANFSDAMSYLIGQGAPDYLRNLGQTQGDEQRLRQQITKIETEVGCSIQDFVEQLADVAAFEAVMTTRTTADRSETGNSSRAIRVYPMLSVVRQDTSNLVTSATVTTIVKGVFKDLCKVIDPANWAVPHGVVQESYYISDPFDFSRVSTVPAFGESSPGALLLNEVAEISWNGDVNEQARFHNVLNILTSVRPNGALTNGDNSAETPAGGPELRQADVDYNLCRSVDSTVLWDKRAGGLRLNQGFIKLRPLGDDNWRVTMRKELQFSDRTPYENGAGWQDFGQLANYLAPATLTWWLECDTYSLGDDGSQDQSTAGTPLEPKAGQ